MAEIYYLKKVVIDNVTNEFTNIILENLSTQSIQEWNLSQELMDFSLEQDIQVKGDPQAQILIYTAKREDKTIKYTIKVFYKGNQENLLYQSSYREKYFL